MPVRISTSTVATSTQTSHIVVHTTATDFLNAALPSLRRRERSANIILAHALKIREEESAGRASYSRYPRVWLTLWGSRAAPMSPITPSSRFASFAPAPAAHADTNSSSVLEMVLSCVDWTLGTYPIFLWTASAPEALSPLYLAPRIRSLATELLEIVPVERVYSVFGATQVTKTFVHVWTQLTGVNCYHDPFYSASYNWCTLETLTPERKGPLPAGHRLRRATPEDVMAAAELCRLFAEETVYFVQTDAQALTEARELIARRVLWVYEVALPSGDVALASLCAVTRSSWNVACITKVYTHPRFRQQGCAERLVRHVVREVLTEHGKSMVTLYVGHTNPAAKVYNHVGFVGLNGRGKVEGVEDWLEIGFQDTDRGHW